MSYGLEIAVCPLQTLRCALQAVSSARPGPKLCFTVWRVPSAPSKPCAAPLGCLISMGQSSVLRFRDCRLPPPAPCRLSHQQGQGQSSVLRFGDCRLPPPNPALRLPGCLISQGQSSVLRFRDCRLPPSNPRPKTFRFDQFLPTSREAPHPRLISEVNRRKARDTIWLYLNGLQIRMK